MSRYPNFKQLLAQRHGDAVKPTRARYTPVLEVRYPLNTSRSKFIAMGLDFEREFAPFVSIENALGRGVILTAKECRQLLANTWVDTVDSHMRSPSYTVRTFYTSRHEFRCSMTEGSAGIMISPLQGEGGYTCLGKVTWDRLRDLTPVISLVLASLERESFHVQTSVWNLLMKHAHLATLSGHTSLEQIKSSLTTELPTYHLNQAEFHYQDAQLRCELGGVYCDMTANLILHIIANGRTALPPRPELVQ